MNNWKIILKDHSEISGENNRWADISEPVEVLYTSAKKTVNICKMSVNKIQAVIFDLEASIEVPEDCFCYQAIRAEALVFSEKSRKDRILGILIGIVKNGEVVEEKYLNCIENKIEGFIK